MKANLLKKVTAGLVATIIVAGTLAGCGSPDADAAADNKTSTENEDSGSGEDAVADNADAGEVTKVYAATGGSPKPFIFIDEEDNLVGHNIELIEAVFEKLPQYELEIEVTDFTSIFAGLDSDRYQIGVNNFAMNDERKEKYLFSDPMFQNRYVALVSSDNDELESVQSLADLAGKSYVGNTAINVTTAVENYNEENPDNAIEINYTEADLIMQLQDVESGKFDFLLMDKPMYEYYNNEYNFELKILELSDDVSEGVMQEPYSYFLVSKGNEELVADINKALAEVIADGTSKTINEKYFGEDYTPSAE